MRVQRIVASLLLSVFLLTPLAPAAIAPPQPVPQHCVRKPLAGTGAMQAGVQCREAGTHAHHHMAPAEPAATPTSGPTDHQFNSNGCCTSHDCCNATVRAQWAQFVPVIPEATVDLIQLASAADFISPRLSPRFDAHSGRAPPAF